MSATTAMLRFANGNTARVLRALPHADADTVAHALALVSPRPALFLSGGASAMNADAMRATNALITDGIARFAAEHGITVIDGGTDAGIMRLMGRARLRYRYRFPLVGCAPHDKITYPGDRRPGDDRTPLEPNHSHFVLVSADYWGAESDMIVGMVRALTQCEIPGCGILINGGKIAQYDVYVASARGQRALPVVIIDGSGRTADAIASASKSGRFDTAMMRAIVEGGQIDIVSLHDGAEALYRRLEKVFAASGG